MLIAGGMTGALGWHTGTVTAYAADCVRDDAEISTRRRGVSPASAAPAPGSIRATSMTASRLAHTATLFARGPLAGKVLLVGGEGAPVGATQRVHEPLDTAELYDPATGTFAATGAMHVRRAMHAALLLP